MNIKNLSILKMPIIKLLYSTPTSFQLVWLCSRAVSFLTPILALRFLGLQVYSEFLVLFSYTVLLQVLASTGVIELLPYYINEGMASWPAWRKLTIPLYFGIVMMLVLSIYLPILAYFVPLELHFSFAAVTYSLVYSISYASIIFYVYYLYFNNFYFQSAVFSFWGFLCVQCLALLHVLITRNPLAYLPSIAIISLVLAALFFFPHIKKLPSFIHTFSNSNTSNLLGFRKHLKSHLLYLASGKVTWLIGYGLIPISAFIGASKDDISTFGVAYSLSSVSGILSSLINQYYAPIIFSQIRSRHLRKSFQTSNLSNTITLLSILSVVLACYFCFPLIIALFHLDVPQPRLLISLFLLISSSYIVSTPFLYAQPYLFSNNSSKSYLLINISSVICAILFVTPLLLSPIYTTAVFMIAIASFRSVFTFIALRSLNLPRYCFIVSALTASITLAMAVANS